MDGVYQCLVLDKVPCVHQTEWGRGEEGLVLLEFQSGGRRSREPGNEKVNQGRDRSYLLHSAQESVTFLRFGAGAEIGSP